MIHQHALAWWVTSRQEILSDDDDDDVRDRSKHRSLARRRGSVVAGRPWIVTDTCQRVTMFVSAAAEANWLSSKTNAHEYPRQSWKNVLHVVARESNR